MLKTCKMFLVIAMHNLQGGNMPVSPPSGQALLDSKGEALHGSDFEPIFKIHSC